MKTPAYPWESPLDFDHLYSESRNRSRNGKTGAYVGLFTFGTIVAMNSDWNNRFEQEILQAEEARAQGKEGMARVCARRAVGIVAGEYFIRHSIQQPGPSAYDRLKRLSSLPAISPEVQEIVGHFRVRVNLDKDLPAGIDLIAEARFLSEILIQPDIG